MTGEIPSPTNAKVTVQPALVYLAANWRAAGGRLDDEMMTR